MNAKLQLLELLSKAVVEEIDREVLSINSNMEDISDLLEVAREHGLETEAVLSALEAMKANPDLSPEQAMAAGCVEWDVV